jgi:hypothetical protein
MRLAGHVTRMKAKQNAYRILVKSWKERANYEDLSVDGRIILKLIIQR